MLNDLRFAIRQLIKQRGFTFVTVLILALGIGANTAVFTLVQTLLFLAPGYTNPSEIVQLFSQDKSEPTRFRSFAYPTFRDIREQNSVLTDVMAYALAMVGIGAPGERRRV